MESALERNAVVSLERQAVLTQRLEIRLTFRQVVKQIDFLNML